MKRSKDSGKGTVRRVLASSGESCTESTGKCAKSSSKRLLRTSIGTKVYRPERTWAQLTPGDSVRIARELQDLSQAELARASGLTQATISGIERGRILLGVERAKRLAVALGVHPAVLLFPKWETEAANVRAQLRRAS
jgi:ribosome-binding protein aMBF1 (putative translation factor)